MYFAGWRAGMTILQRYILREYLIPFAYCMAAFCLVYLVYDLFERFPEFVEARVPIAQILLFYAHYLFAVNGFVPYIVAVLPFALLLSELYALVNMARHNEFTAMRASGISLATLITPFLVVGVLASLAALLIQETIGPDATRWTYAFNRRQVETRDAKKAFLHTFYFHSGASQRYWVIPRFDFQNPGKLRKVTVTQNRPDGSLAQEYFAERAEWLDGVWWFFGMRTRKYTLREEPTGIWSRTPDKPVEMDFTESPDDFLGEWLKSDLLSSWDMYKYLVNHPNLSQRSQASRKVDLHARLAMPWTCIVVILLGIPAIMTSGRKGALLTVMLAISFMFLFYFVVHFGMVLGKRELLMSWVAGWLPNIVFTGIGIYMLRKIAR